MLSEQYGYFCFCGRLKTGPYKFYLINLLTLIIN